MAKRMGENPEMPQALLTRTERRKEKTRGVLMSVALDLFYEKGIYWTTVENMTERADVGKGTFYQHFETKEAILFELFRNGLDALLAHTEEAIQAALPGRKVVSTVIDCHLNFFLENPKYLLLFHQVRGLLQLKTAEEKGLKEMYNTYLRRLGRSLMPALTKKSSIRAALELGMVLSALISGFVTHHLLFGKPGALKRNRNNIQEQIEQSINAIL
ncbi:MAG: TetR/AcrR family transcriptional regulator [Nitrospiria bacterium]